tara:strand:- start:3779 stop:4363 length:585 start_codon:yes stop_codon:yes gene_type:complete
MTEFVDFIQQGKVSKVKDELETQLQHKLNAKIELKKKDIAASMFTGSPQPMESEEVNESIPEVFNEANKMTDIVKDILDDWEKTRGTEKELKKLIKTYAKKNRLKEKDLEKAVETGQVESVDIINKLKNITDSTYITFKDNSKLKIDNETASVILNVYENLNDENKNKLEKTLEQNQTTFLKMTDFAFSCLEDK